MPGLDGPSGPAGATGTIGPSGDSGEKGPQVCILKVYRSATYTYTYFYNSTEDTCLLTKWFRVSLPATIEGSLLFRARITQLICK